VSGRHSERWNNCADSPPDVYSNDSQRFASLFRRVLSMCLDTSLSNVIRTHLLSFLICAFQSLDNGLLRKECAPLVSISIWQHLESDIARERRFEQNPQFRKAWRASTKRHAAADGELQAKLHFERAWLFSMITDFMSRLQERSGGKVFHSHYDSRLTSAQTMWSIVRGFWSFLQISKANCPHEDMSIP